MINHNRKWFDGIQALRGMLFLLVFISHSSQFVEVNGLWGAAAVSTFFLLSGFLAYFFYDVNAHHEHPIVEGVKNVFNRCAKFYPLYFIFLLVAFVLNKKGVIVNRGGVLALIKSIFLIQSYFFDEADALSLNWPGWFLSSILLSWLLAPLVSCILCKVVKSDGFACFFIAVLWGVQLYLGLYFIGASSNGEPGYYYIYLFPLTRFVDFVIGMLIAVVYKTKSQGIRDEFELVDLVEGIVILVYVFLLASCTKLFPESFGLVSLWTPISCGLVWIFADMRGIFTNQLCTSSLMYLGDISFELYISHRMILMIFTRLDNNVLSLMFAFLTTVIISTIARRLRDILKAKKRGWRRYKCA